LDFNTEGVLLLTNDGDLADRLSHARNGVQRVYDARVRGIPTEAVIERLVRGVMLDDGFARVEFARVVRKTDRNAWVRLALNEGRNREVRRLLERVGHPVMRLRRVSFAGVTAEGLEPGRWRELSEPEFEELDRRGQLGAFAMPPDPRRRRSRKDGPPVPRPTPPRRGAKAKAKRQSGTRGERRTRRGERKP
jgi:23S rRNA pseudouridine2605 synthase